MVQHGGPGGVPGGVPVSQDPVMMQVLRQQMLLTQSMVDFLSRTAQGAGAVPPLPGAARAVPQAQVAQEVTGQGSETSYHGHQVDSSSTTARLEVLEYNRSKELSGFKGWLDKFASWLCLVHDSYAQELKEAMNLPYPVVISEPRPSNSKPSIVSFTSAEFFWIL